MKQTLVLVALMMYLTCRSVVEPFWAVLMYYALVVLRPQAIWNWALPTNVRWSLYAALVAIAVTAFRTGAQVRPVAQKTFRVLIVLFGLCLLASYIGAINRDRATVGAWEHAKILIMLIVGSYALTERRHVRYLAWTMFACAIYLVYELNAVYLFEGRVDICERGYGGYDNNGAALGFAMMLPFCYHFFLAEHHWWRWLFLACAVPTVHVVLLSFSRGAMLSVLVIGTVMLLASLRRRPGAALITALLLTVATLSLAGQQVRTRFMTTLGSEFDSSTQARLTNWRAGWRIAHDFPLFGAGLRNASLLVHQYGADRKGRSIHNVYLQVAADAGIPAAALYVTLLGASLVWLAQGVHRASARGDDPEQRWHHHICQACFWSLLTFAFGSIFLSMEVFELSYLLMLMASVAPVLANQPRVCDRSLLIHERPRRPTVAMLTGGDAPA